ncbi:DUF1566 domain-containing protein, partial [Flavobacteriales bacterium]|nr:DUF1566 domain-containing protein [Flavobacteriales bacterium]
IGDTYQGGKIFYLDNNGGGLIYGLTVTLPGFEWGCNGTLVSGAMGTAIGTGAQNTIDIINGCTSTNTAAYYCDTLSFGGYNDWFLPSKDELNKLYQNRYAIQLYVGYDYWTSTQMDQYSAYHQSFNNGTQSSGTKHAARGVHAIRSFSPLPGCTDPTANNYNTNATTDDGSCSYTVPGCTDSLALNYDVNATINDSSLCCYISGCMDVLANNYDPLACLSNSSCTYDITNITQNTGSNVIQNVVDLANNGDTVIIAPGTYVENVNIVDKSIHIASMYLTTGDSSYISSTIIDGNNTGSAIWIHESTNQGQNSTQDVNVTGLKLINGSDGGSNDDGGGLSVKWCNSVIIDRLDISSSSGTYGGGISLAYTALAKISNSHIYNNSSNDWAGGINCAGHGQLVGKLEITNTLINDNTGGNSGGGIVTDSDTLIIANSTVANNTGGHETGGIHIRSGNNHSLLYNNIVSNNLNPMSNNQISCNSNQNNEYLYNNYYNAVGGNPLVDFENVLSQVDPFVNSISGDFHLNDSNLAIGAGADSVYFLGDYYYSTPLDYNNKNRPTPLNSSPDIGAFENDRAQPFYVKTYVPDDVFEFYLEGQGWGDGIAFNDSVLTENIQFLTSLEVSDLGISDMTGIEDFISLNHLGCFRNTISSIDLSNNVLLVNLIIAENDLTELDLSNNPLLEHLEVHDNLLDSFDLSNQSSLTFLWIEDNPTLSFLDLRNGATSPMTLRALNNPNLYCIDVDNPFLANLMWSNANNSIDPWTSFSTNCFLDLGCTDSTTCNYNPNATVDDGSCILGNCVENITQNTFTPDIQSGIDASVNGDTIIVSSGTYTENINFNGKNIFLSSEFLFNNDTSYISSTIIDGGTVGPTVLFNDQEENAHLIGFTITQGWCGVMIENANSSNIGPFLTNLYFTNNGNVYSGSSIQGGCNHNISVVVDKCEFFNNSLNQNVIYLCNVNNSDATRFPLIKNSKFYNNNVTGGVVIFNGENSKMENCVIRDNVAYTGVHFYQGFLSHNLLNSTIVNNSGYGLFVEAIHRASIANIENSIIWGNNSNLEQIGIQLSQQTLSLNIDYSVLQGGNNYTQIGNGSIFLMTDNYGSNNLEVDPDLNTDYSLSNFSPAIGAGNSSTAFSIDILGGIRPNPAGSNPDMGAYENSLATPDILGCMDSLATNYNASANISDSSCTNCYATADIGSDTISGCDSVLISTNTITNATYNWSTSNVLIPLQIGDTYQGGIVFYLDSLGGGLISAPSDQSTGAEWGCYGTQISGADGTAIGTGYQNTIDIEAGCTTPGTAADICANLTLGGYSDWFLPSKGELIEIYSTLGPNAFGQYNNNIAYWTSSEYSEYAAYRANEPSSNSWNNKIGLHYVRAIREISLNTNSLTVSTSGWNYIFVTDSLGCTAMDSVYVIVNTSGCTDPVAGNYDINATCDDGSCCYADTSYTNITACDSVVWNGVTYDSSGQFTYTPEFMQIGQDIDGEAYDDHSGKSVSISADGNKVAIGAFLNDGNGSNSGHVRVYENIGGFWSQIGQDIDGDTAGAVSGRSVSISDDGNTVAIGATGIHTNNSTAGHVRIYQNIGGSWSQIGQDILGEGSDDQSGFSVSLCSDGNTVAIGAYKNDGSYSNSGHVRIYQNIGGSWTQLGQDIDGEAANDYSGFSVSLCSDGNTVAIGAFGNDANGGNEYSSGHVRVFNWNGSSWIQLGQDIDGQAADDWSGRSVSLSADGNVVAIGAPHSGNGSGYNSMEGYVSIYNYNGSAWNQVGQNIEGQADLDNCGASVSLSDDGNRVAIGTPGNVGDGSSIAGYVSIYENIGGSWSQIDQDVNGEAQLDESGMSVSLSANGNTVAIGAPGNDGNGLGSGHVRVYNLPSLTNTGGCDSTAILNLTITNANTSTTNITSCDSYTWNGTTYTSSGSYSWLGTNIESCDSTATLNLTITNSSTSDTYVSVCDADYSWNGVAYTVTGDYDYVTTNAIGCDSTATLHLTVSYSNSGSESITACDSYFWQGNTYTSSGVYTSVLTNVAACDSVATLNLTINNSYPSSNNITDYYICDGQSVTIANSTYTTPGTYTDVLTADNGCDSTVVSIVHVSYLALTPSSTPVTCANWNDGSVEVNASGGIPPYTYSWNTGDNTSQMDQLPMGSYDVTVSDIACSLTTSISVDLNIAPADSMHPEICYVSVDNTGFNKLVLSPLENPLTSQYVILRQVSANQYAPLDILDANTLEYVDSTSNPSVQAERYKVSAIDACGNGTDTSDYHKTVHLTMSLGVNGEVNLIWNSYEGYQVSSYLIYRGNSASNMNMIGTTAGNNSSYTDLAPPTGFLQYQIRAFAQNCNPIPNATILPDTLESNIIDHNNSGATGLTVSITSQDPSCSSCNDGYAFASASGGTVPYFYNWSNGTTGAFNAYLGVGTYTVFVSDSDGNTDSESVTLTSLSVSGCTDPTANNYDPTATTDDGSCTYPSICTEPTPTGL